MSSDLGILDYILCDHELISLDSNHSPAMTTTTLSSGCASSISEEDNDVDVVLGAHVMLPEASEDKMDLLSTSLYESGILLKNQNDVWAELDNDTDALLDSILIGGNSPLTENIASGSCLDFEIPLSDDESEDSGCNVEQQLLSPTSSNQNMDVISSGTDEDEQTLQIVNPRTNSPERKLKKNPATPAPASRFLTSGFQKGTTTIILPVLTSTKTLMPTKRRRISDSSSDSGNSSIGLRASLDEPSPKSSRPLKGGGSLKYPALHLTEEEKRICERENIKLPTHFPLTKEEERNLKRIRRKIRNKVSAQDSRRRKKEYLDNMEERFRQCSVEKEELEKRIEQLETQNKTLAGQLRRIHQIIVNGGFTSRQNQASTALMVLLLSTALFLIPGFREQHEGRKSESSQIDISQAIKMPPMAGQSRSLLNFVPIKQEFDDTIDTPGSNNMVVVSSSSTGLPSANKMDSQVRSFEVIVDHDYFSGFNAEKAFRGSANKRSYIDADVPPEGYGYIKDERVEDEVVVDDDDDDGDDDDDDDADGNNRNNAYFITEEEIILEMQSTPEKFASKNHKPRSSLEDRQLNVSVATARGSGIRTVVLHVPKDIK